MVEKKEYSFELHQDLLKAIEQDFRAEEIARQFCQSVQGKSAEEQAVIGEKLFTEYGENWGHRSVALGETYMDRTYEILKEALDQTGGSIFPLVPQRFLEIAYLGVQDFPTLPIIENNSRRLIYRVEDCKTYGQIAADCGQEIAKALCCRHGCLGLCRTVAADLDIEGVSVDMTAQTPKQGYCEFAVSKAPA